MIFRKKWLKLFIAILFSISILVLGSISYLYYNIQKTAEHTYTPIKGKVVGSAPNNNKKQPFSLLLLGVDTGDYGRTGQGRTDTILVATVNPKNNSTTLVSIPRDSYTEIIGTNQKDKINHAYAYGGISMTIATVENLLDIPINNYIEVNLKGLQELVDSLGGITVSNKFSFDYEGVTFPIGKQNLNGVNALKYSRMRYEDPNGDYGRQDRQRQVIMGMIEKIKKIDTLTNYKNILSIMQNNLKTDLKWEGIQNLFLNYKSSLNQISSIQLQGRGFTGDGNKGKLGISYQELLEDQLVQVKQNLSDQLKY